MAEVGSASFSAKANFGRLRRQALQVAQALQKVEEARKGASGPLNFDVDERDLKRARVEVEQAIEGADPDPVEVDADTSPFRRGLQRAMAAVSRERVDVPVEADTAGLSRQVSGAVRRAESAAGPIDIPVNVDSESAQSELRELQVMTRSGAWTVRVPVELTGANLASEIRRQVALAEQATDGIDVPVEADGSGVRREVGLIARAASLGQKIKIQTEVDGGGIKKGLSDLLSVAGGFASRFTALLGGLLAIPALVAGINYAAAAMSALAAGAAGALASLAPLVGLLATLPSLGAAAAGAFGAVKLAFMGVGAALKGYSASQKASAKAAADTGAAESAAAKQREAALRGVVRAQQGVADAQKRAAELQEAAIRRVASAERGLSTALRTAQRAQENLTRARKEAAEQLEDLRRQVNRNALDEESARLSIDEARLNLQEVMADPESTELDRRRALLQLKQAEQDLLDVQDQRADDQARLNELERQGIEGSDAVIDAKQGVLDADLAVIDAQRELQDAQAGVAAAQVEGARLVADAQQNLVDAMRAVQEAAVSAGAAGATALDPFEEALKDLPASAQAFVRHLVSLEPLLDRLRTIAADNLFPGLTRGLDNVVTLMPIAERLTGMFARSVGNAAENISGLALEDGFRNDLNTIGETGVRAFDRIAGAAKPVLRSLVGVGAEASGLTDRVVGLTARWSELAAAWLDSQRANGNMAKFFQKTGDVFEHVAKALGYFVEGLVRIGKIAYDVFGDLTGGLEDSARAFRDWTKSGEGVAKITKFFEDSKEPLREMWLLLKDLAAIFFDLGKDTNLAEIIRQIRTDFLPVLKEFMDSASGEFGTTLLKFLTDVADLMANLSTEGGPLIMFLKVMSRLVEVLDWVAENVPFATEAFTALAIAAGTLSAIRFTAFITGLSSIVRFATAKNAAGVTRFSQALTALGIGSRGAAAAAPGAAGGIASVSGAAAAGSLPLWGWVLIIAAVVAAIAGLAYVIYTNWESIKKFTSDALSAIDDLLEKVPFYNTAKRIMDRVVEAFRGGADRSRDEWDRAMSGVGDAHGRGEERYSGIIDRFDREAQELLDGYERTKERLQKDLDLGLITQQQYDDGLAALDAYLQERQRQLAEGRQNEITESQKQTDAEVAEAERRRQKLTEHIHQTDPGFFERRLNRQGFDPGMIEESRRANRELELSTEGMAGKIQIVLNRIGYFFTDTFHGIAAVVTSAKDIVVKTVLEMLQGIQQKWELLKTMASVVWNTIVNTITTAWNTIVSTVQGKIEEVRIWIAVKLAEIRTLWDSMWDATVGRLQQTWETIKNTVAVALDAMWQWISTKLAQIRAIWDQVWGWLSTSASNAWNWIRGVVQSGIDTVGRVISNTLGWIRSTWDSVWNGMRNVLGGVWSGIQSAVRSGVNGVIGILNTLIRGANSVLGRLPGGLKIPTIGFRMNTGGEVPGTGSYDKVPALLTPREFVTRRAIVEREGVSKFEALNRGEATIVPIDRKRRERQQRLNSGGLVGGGRVQRFARGGIVDRARGVVGGALDWAQGMASGALRKLWEAARSLANGALSRVKDQDKIPQNMAVSAGREMLKQFDGVIQSGLNALAGEEAAKRRRDSERAKAARPAPKQARSSPRPKAPARQVGRTSRPKLGDVAANALRQQFPSIQIQNIGSFLRVWNAPLDQIVRFVAANDRALRVRGIRSGGPGALNLDVYHGGGGVGFDPSKEMMALLQRGEGVIAADAMRSLNTQLTAPTSGAVGRGAVTYVNVEVNNPVGEPTEDSVHRELQKLAAHGVLPVLEEAG